MQYLNNTNTKKEKNGSSGLEKETLQKTLFASALTIAREVPHKNQREKP